RLEVAHKSLTRAAFGRLFRAPPPRGVFHAHGRGVGRGKRPQRTSCVLALPTNRRRVPRLGHLDEYSVEVVFGLAFRRCNHYHRMADAPRASVPRWNTVSASNPTTTVAE